MKMSKTYHLELNEDEMAILINIMTKFPGVEGHLDWDDTPAFNAMLKIISATE
jgi:hypothetical protein